MRFCWIFMIFLCGCVSMSTELKEIKPNEIGLSPEFNGRIFSINCTAPESWGSKFKVQSSCLERAAKIAHERNFKHFTVLNQAHSAHTRIYTHRTTTPVTTTTTYRQHASAHGHAHTPGQPSTRAHTHAHSHGTEISIQRKRFFGKAY